MMSDTLRAAIEKSGQSVSDISRESGIPQPMLSRFVAGKDLRLATAEKLAAYFGLELRDTGALQKPAKPKPKAKR